MDKKYLYNLPYMSTDTLLKVKIDSITKIKEYTNYLLKITIGLNNGKTYIIDKDTRKRTPLIDERIKNIRLINEMFQRLNITRDEYLDNYGYKQTLIGAIQGSIGNRKIPTSLKGSTILSINSNINKMKLSDIILYVKTHFPHLVVLLREEDK